MIEIREVEWQICDNCSGSGIGNLKPKVYVLQSSRNMTRRITLCPKCAKKILEEIEQ